jgi:molybdopterin/thiamine biosynthesis adenylyltransferase
LLLRQLTALLDGDRNFIQCAAGVCRRGDTELEVYAARSAVPAGSLLRLSTEESYIPFLPQALPDDCVACLRVGHGPLRGSASGWIRDLYGSWEPAARLILPGPGMKEVILSTGQTGEGIQMLTTAPLNAISPRWSRTAGALGVESYSRATSLKIGLVGLGRLGSLLARGLVRFGVRQMVVADPDQVEIHNTGEGEFELPQIGISKVHAWARQMAIINPELEVVAVQEGISTLAALEALKSCDFLFSAPDQPGARLATAAVAAAYCRPLIDIGTRVHRDGLSTMGADVRLITPERCLLCFGGVADESLGLRLLESPDEEEWFSTLRDWQDERPGSLASLNSLAAAIALRAFEDLVADRLQGSLWCHIEFLRNGQLQVNYPTPTPSASPASCACAISGWGDAGLAHFTSILRRREQTQPRAHT